jgi:YcxB-like protein
LFLTIFMFLIVTISTIYQNFSEDWTNIFFMLFLVLAFPLSINIAAKKNYKTDLRISANFIYEINEELINVTGESFNSQLNWPKCNSVTENKDWFLIWQNRQSAYVLPKRNFEKDELVYFKNLTSKKRLIK